VLGCSWLVCGASGLIPTIITSICRRYQRFFARSAPLPGCASIPHPTSYVRTLGQGCSGKIACACGVLCAIHSSVLVICGLRLRAWRDGTKVCTTGFSPPTVPNMMDTLTDLSHHHSFLQNLAEAGRGEFAAALLV
jgi:hypothetical protein